MRINISKFTSAFDYFYILGLLGVAATVLIPREADIAATGSTFSFTLFWVILYSFTGLFLVLRSNWYQFNTRELLVIGLGVYAVISTLWSNLASQTFFYSVSLLANIVFAIYCARKYQLREFFYLITKTVILVCLFGIILFLLGYEKTLFIDPLSRSNFLGFNPIKGLFSHKIYSGVYSSLIIPFIFVYFHGIRRVSLLLLVLFSVAISGSATGLLLALFTLAAMFFSERILKYKINSYNLLIAIVTVVFVLVFITTSSAFIFESVGRDADLTGRTELWGWAFWFFGKSPVVGWGYLGIFSDALNAPSQIIFKGSYYKAPHFHNSYLQVLAELGIIGFTVFIYYFIGVVKRVFSSTVNGGSFSFACFICVSLIFISGFVVNAGFKYNEFLTVVLLYMFLARKAANE